MECKHCGAEVGMEYRLCPYCKSEMDYPKPNQQPVIIQNIIQQPMNTQDYNNYNQNYNQGYNQGYNQNYNQPPQQNYNNGYQAPYQSQPAPYQNNNFTGNDNSLAQVSPKSKVVALVLAILLEFHDFLRCKTENKGIFFSHLIYDLNVRAVQCSQSYSAVKHHLHVTGS